MSKDNKDIVGAADFTIYDKVKTETTAEYFKGNQFSIDAFESKYALVDKPDETYVQALKRVCDYIASVEKTEANKEYWSKRWFHEIYNDWWHPAGSIMQGAGSGRKVSLANCFSSETEFITNRGVKSFDDFNDGDTAKVMNNMGAFTDGIIKNHGRQRLFKLTVGRHTIKKDIYCTLDHIWRVALKGDTIVEKTTADLNEGDQLPYTKRKWMQSQSGSRYYCPIGFIHGYTYGDGDFDKENNTCNINLCGDSKDLISLFKGFDWNCSNAGNETIRIKYLPNWMKTLPDINKLNEEYLLGFLIGYFAADGTVDEDGRSELASANIDNLLFIKNISESLGIYSSDIRLIREESPFDGNKEHKLYGLYFWKDCLFDSFFTKKSHKEKWENHKNSIKNDKSRVNWKVISLVETDRMEDVWCVSVKDGNNFTLQGGVNTHNCTTISLGVGREHEEWDSLEAIIKNTGYTVAKTAAYRQGLGVDFSRLRPRGTGVQNSAKESTGSVHWMAYIDGMGNFVGQKGRIPAMLFSLSCSHPDVEEFIAVKANTGKIQNANISVQCTDEFYDAVKEGKNWDLTFEIPEVKKGQKVYIDEHSATRDCKKDDKGWYYLSLTDRKKETIKKTVKARDLMQLIAKNMHSHAEPGIQNIDIARKYSNSDYVYDPNDEYDSRIVSTNACSEQYLSRESLCVLASINCGKLSKSLEDYDKELSILSPSICRFLDNVNECEVVYNTYATAHQKVAIKKLRRIGAGFTNIAAWLFNANVAYGSDKSAELMEKLTERYSYYLYKSSIELGQEKGSFELFNQEKIERSPFIKRMKKLGLEFKTLRNVTLTSIAPTGTLSLMFRDSVMSYGIEPAFGMYYWKRTRMKGKYQYYFNVPSIVRKVFKDAGIEIPVNSDTISDDWKGTRGKPIADFIDANRKKLGLEFKSATDITCTEKLELMAKVMKWVDSSISVTYMLPENSTWKDVYDFIMLTHEKEVKSIAAFPDKKMYGIIAFVPFKDLAMKLKQENVLMPAQNFSDEELKELSMSRQDVVVNTRVAPERDEVLDAEIYSITVNKEKFIIAIGLQNGYPYEIFGGKMKDLKIEMDSKHLQGKLTKIKGGQYSLEFEETVIKDFSKQFAPVEKVMFRLLSLDLRKGIPIEEIVEQMNKSSDDMFSLPAAISRVLKKYIRDGQKANGRTCPNCGSHDLIYNNGCVQCSNCNYSACN